MRRAGIVGVILLAVGVVAWVWRGLSAAASLQPGMVVLHLPSGATAYLRRQSYFDKPAKVYITSNSDFCAPYDRWHDYKLPPVIQGGPESPVLISYVGNTVIVHSPEPLRRPLLARPRGFNVSFQALSPAKYAAYVRTSDGTVELPESWVSLEIPFGHNTCAL